MIIALAQPPSLFAGDERRSVVRPCAAIAALAFVLQGCASSELAAPSAATQTIGYSSAPLAAAAAATTSTDESRPLAASRPAPERPSLVSNFHETMLKPYHPTSQEMMAALAVEDDMGRNPDGSFRLPPPIRIPVIDISTSYSALAGDPTHTEAQPVDISVPW